MTIFVISERWSVRVRISQFLSVSLLNFPLSPPFKGFRRDTLCCVNPSLELAVTTSVSIMFSGPRSLLVAFLGTMALQGWSFSPPASSLPPVSRYSQPRQSSFAGSVSGSTASTKETMEKLESLQALLREIKEKAPTTEGIDLSRIEKGLGDVKAMAAQAASEAEALATAAFEGATKTTGGGFLLSTANSMKSTMVTLWSMLQQFAPPLGLPFLIAASLAASAVGFTSFVRFFSLGYGASMASLGVLALAMAPKGRSSSTPRALAVKMLSEHTLSSP